ncbi:MAG: trypsin-like serine protease [Methylovulum sp.]|nr:trypsin-like serine protease [Methylovulum sp.]
MKMNKFYSLSTTGLLCVAGGLALATSAAEADVQQIGAVTIMTAPAQTGQSEGAGIDFANAIPMPLPKADASLFLQGSNAAPVSFGVPGHSEGSTGDGKETPVTVPKSNFIPEGEVGVAPQEFGTTNHPYTTSQVNAYKNRTSKFYPYRATGKLYFNEGGSTFVCSASLIKPGVIVTAAHCVADFGKKTFYSNWTFIPAHNGTLAPYGIWDGISPVIMTSYYDGTDSCASPGVVCQNDVAVIKLAAKPIRRTTYYAGDKTGWYAYGWNGYSYAPFLRKTAAQISQLGYPQAIDGGDLMERTDSLGYVDGSFSNNTIIGSLQTGGSSGGPWLVNLGMEPSLAGTDFGSDTGHNTVVGVTSWGYISDLLKEQGASPFTDGNIVTLVNAVCEPAPQPGC